MDNNKNDKLFKSDFDWQNNACLNYLSDNWWPYVAGYKRAADLLVEYVKDTHRNQDILVYPIVFLYRQYLELLLKQIIQDGSRLLDMNQTLPKNHKINNLWEQSRKILIKVWPDADLNDLNTIEQCINQLSETDPFSTAFRYPTDKEDNPSLPDIKHINLRNLSEIINKTASLLEGVSAWIGEYLENKLEMKAEYREI